MNISAIFVYVALILIVIGVGFYLFVWPKLSKNIIREKKFDTAWDEILHKRLPIYHKLLKKQKQHLQDLMKVFLHQKDFIGCAGQDITEEIKVVIAAQACLLLLNRTTSEYQDLTTIYVYPTSFKATREVRDELGLVSTESNHLLGESWSTGKVILAWDNVEKGIRNFTDGHNVVIHEFAHQLDQESGTTNGAPILSTRAAYKSWAYVFGKEFEILQKNKYKNNNVINEYGATNPAEFFAVASETFFEEPHKLYKNHKALFEELQAYYQLDPRDWT
ncbi:MAG: zinc-dependent peptidase [Cellvibrionaceae bacterium]